MTAHLPLDDAYAIEIYPDGTVQLRWTDDDDRQMWLTRGDVAALVRSADPRLERWRTAKVIRGIGAAPEPNPFAAWGLEEAGTRTTAVLADWTWQLVPH